MIARRSKRFLHSVLSVKRLSNHRLQFLCRQLAFALGSGLALPTSLHLVSSEQQHRLSRQLLQQCAQGMQQGLTMSQILEQSQIKTSPVFLEFVYAGEQNGTIRETLVQAADYFERQQQMKQSLLAALSYPMVLLVMMTVALGAMIRFVVPILCQSYENVQAQLPYSTRMLIGINQAIERHGSLALMLLLGAIGAALWIVQSSMQKPANRDRMIGWILAVPLVGRLYQQYWFIQISQGMALMLSSGMLLVDCLHAMETIYRRSLFVDEIHAMAEQLRDGYTFDACIRSCRFVPEVAGQMLILSEKTGMLAVAMRQMNGYYRQQFQNKVQTVIRMLEPCFIVLMGLAILLMASSLFLPLMQSYQYIQ